MMKKLLTLLTIGLFAFHIGTAQTNLDFESWTGNSPDDWATMNAFAALGAPLTCFQETADPGEGASSAKIVTGYWAGATNFGAPSDTVGGMAILGPGTPGMTDVGLAATFTFTSMSFKYKSAPGPGDTCAALVSLSHWDDSLKMQIPDYMGLWTEGATVSTWTDVTMPVYPTSMTPGTPDSLMVIFISSAASFGLAQALPYVDSVGANGSALWVDAVVFGGVDSLCVPPTAEFTATVSGDAVTITNNSSTTGTATYSYDYGDGSAASSSDTHTYTASGTYTITLTVTDSCGTDTDMETVTVNVTPPVSVVENGSISVSLFPNPAIHSTTIETKGYKGTYNIQLFNMIGQTVMEANSIPAGKYIIDRGDIKNGVYFMKIRTEKDELVQKVVFE